MAKRRETPTTPSPVAVKVKPLEWEDMGHCWRAKTILGDYEAGWDDGAWAVCEGPSMWEWSIGQDHRSLSVFHAKAAAQADYEARILSALEATPSPEAIARAAWERAAQTSLKAATFGLDAYDVARLIRALADDPAEINAILLKAAGEDRG